MAGQEDTRQSRLAIADPGVARRSRYAAVRILSRRIAAAARRYVFVKYLLDTNVLCDFARGEQAVMARLRQEAPPQVAVSVVTEMEVEYGLARNPNLAPRVREAMRMLLKTISVLPFEREDARVAAQLRASQIGRASCRVSGKGGE